MGTLIVQRPDDWGGRYRNLKVIVDETERAGLRPNGDERFELPAGEYQVQGRMDWATCQPLLVNVPDVGEVCVELSLPLVAVFASFVRPRRAVRARIVAP